MRSGFARDSIAMAASQYLARAIVVARGVAAAVALGPRGMGGWNALNLILDYGQYASGGAVQGLDLALPGALEAGDEARVRRLEGAAWSAVAMGGALFALALAITLAITFVRGGRAFAANAAALPWLMLVAALAQLGFLVLASMLRARGRIPAVSLAYTVQAVVGGGLGIAAVWRFGIAGMIVSWILGTACGCAVMLGGGARGGLHLGSARAAVALARAGLPIFACFLATLVQRSVDRLALVRYANPQDLGVYSLGLMVAGSMLYVPEAVAYVLFPRLAAAAAGARDPEHTRAEVVRAHRAVTLVMPIAAALAMVWAEPLVARWLPAFRAGLPALDALAIGALMLAAANLPGYALLASDQPGAMVARVAAAAALNALLVFVVAARDPRPVAVAAATAAGYAVYAFWMIAVAGRIWCRSGAERAWLLAVSVGPSVWAVAATFAVMFAIRGVTAGASFASALLASAIVIAVYAPVAAWLGRGVGLRGLAREWLGARKLRYR